MLKNVPKIVSLELLKTLSEMGHVDEKDIYRPANQNLNRIRGCLV